MPDDGNTPLDGDELDGLIPEHIATRADVNEWEALNIARAHEWLAGRRGTDAMDVSFLRELHSQMFGMTWEWAGSFRRTDKNISLRHWTEVPSLIRSRSHSSVAKRKRAACAARDRSTSRAMEAASFQLGRRGRLGGRWRIANRVHPRFAKS